MGNEEIKSSVGWTLWKEIVGTAIAVLPFAIMFGVWMANITARVMVLEAAKETQSSIDRRQDEERVAALDAQVRTDHKQDEAVAATLARIEVHLNELDRYLRENKR